MIVEEVVARRGGSNAIVLRQNAEGVEVEERFGAAKHLHAAEVAHVPEAEGARDVGRDDHGRVRVDLEPTKIVIIRIFKT